MTEYSIAPSLVCPLCTAQKTMLFYQDAKNFQNDYHHCLSCDLVFVAPSCYLDAEAEKARYDMHNNDNSEAYVNFLSRLASPMLEVIPQTSAGLDFGSGVSQAMAELFREKGHECHCYDIFYYPNEQLLSQPYDFIIASEVIEHLYSPKKTFEQWLSILKPSGVLGVMTGLRPKDEAFPNWWYKNDPTHVMLFSAQTFKYLQAQYALDCIYQKGNVLLFRKG